MTGLFVVCISILVSTGSAAPQSRLLSAERTVERMSRGVQPRDDRVSLIGNWDYPASTALLDEFMIDSSITRVGAIGDQTEPAGAFGAGTYLVVWRDAWRDDIYGARLDTNGVVLDSSGIPI